MPFVQRIQTGCAIVPADVWDTMPRASQAIIQIRQEL